MENISRCNNTNILPLEFYPKTAEIDHITLSQVQLRDDIPFTDVILNITSGPNIEDIDRTTNGKFYSFLKSKLILIELMV